MSSYVPIYRFCGPRVNSIRVTCFVYGLFFQAVTLVCYKSVQFALAVDYIRYYDPFELLQAKAKCIIGRALASGPG